MSMDAEIACARSQRACGERWPQFNRLREDLAKVSLPAERAIVAQLTEGAFRDAGNRYPQIFRYIAQELATAAC